MMLVLVLLSLVQCKIRERFVFTFVVEEIHTVFKTNFQKDKLLSNIQNLHISNDLCHYIR